MSETQQPNTSWPAQVENLTAAVPTEVTRAESEETALGVEITVNTNTVAAEVSAETVRAETKEATLSSIISPGQNAPSGRNPVGYGNSATELFNFDTTKMFHTRNALARILSGSGRGTIAVVGDSTTRGVGAGTGGTEYTDIKAYSYSAQLAKKLSGAGIPSLCQSMFGTSNYGSNSALTLEDPLFTMGADWSIYAAAGIGVGGGLFHQAAGGTTAIGYTPTISWDTVKILYANAAGGTASVKSGTTSIGTLTSTSATTMGLSTFTQPLAVGEFNVTWAASGSIYLNGFWLYNSTIPGFDILNLGWGGSTAENWVAQVNYSCMAGLAALDPDLTIINLGINDWGTLVSIATYQVSIQTLITQALSYGDCVLVVPIPSEITATPVATQAQYIDVLYELAALNNIPLIDLTYRDVSWALGNSFGWYYNNLHHNALGYADDAQAFLKLLLAL